jgi:hypothetical protein
VPFNLTLDLFSAIEKFVEFRKLNEWVKLILQLACSFIFSASFASGAALVIHRPPWEALGEGLMAGPTFAVIIWRRSPLTKGLMLALPEKEAGEGTAGRRADHREIAPCASLPHSVYYSDSRWPKCAKISRHGFG